MKKLIYLGLAVFVVLLNGCLIYSVNCFYTDDLKVEAPGQILGDWKLLVSYGENVEKKNITPWLFSKEQIISYDTKNKCSDFAVTFFKINNVLLADVVPKSSLNNDYWNCCVVPMHILVKVVLKKDKLELIPLNVEWFKKSGNTKVKDLPYAGYEGKDDIRIYNVSSAKWVKFLKANISNKNLFWDKNKFVLTKLKQSDSKSK
jgi:hypothetical protein